MGSKMLGWVSSRKKKFLPTSTKPASRSDSVWVIWYGTDLEEPGHVEWDDKEEWTEISRMKTLLTKDLQHKRMFFINIIKLPYSVHLGISTN